MKSAAVFAGIFAKHFRQLWLPLLVLLILISARPPLHAAATLTQQVDPPEANVGDQVSVVFTIQGGSDASIDFPKVEGLPVEGTSSTTQITFSNGSLMSAASQTFTLVPRHPGDFTIPAFDIRTRDGEVLHARAMKLHVLSAGASAPTNSPSPTPPQLPGGPVVMPPPMATTNAPPGADGSNEQPETTIQAPTDTDGRPARVFMVVTAKTTDAYVGETVPVRIEFFIRMDSMAPQDSLPTTQGSDFLMNDLSVRPAEDEVMVQNEPFHRETWVTAISAPRSGDFPLQMVRDTYWTKNPRNLFADPLGNFFNGRSNLVHGSVPSNKLIFHSRALPQEGKPADFTGAIGQFKATGAATPATLNVGDPATLDFTVSGEGNFDSVRCPTLTPDPAWKSYVASSQVHYVDESHTQGEKDFRQSIIPLRNGQLPLPAASFSYFDPTANKYVTIPIPLPALLITGSPLPVTPTAAPPAATSVPAAAPAAPTFTANRMEFGKLTTGLMPPYRQPWFWISQASLLLLALFALLGFAVQSRYGNDRTRNSLALRERSLHELEIAMSDAVACGNVPAFFLAARRAVQLRWGADLGLAPEAVSVEVLTAHDAQLGEAAAPLYQQADEILYSGQASGELDLAEWERSVRGMLLQPQHA